MTQWQRAVKYIAMALAILLAVTIIFGIVSAVSSLGLLFGDDSSLIGEMKEDVVSGEVSRLDVELEGASLKIKSGEEFLVESNLKNLSVRVSGGTLSVVQEHIAFTSVGSSASVIIYIPEGTVFDKASIETGAGKLDIDTLSAEYVDLDLGAGQVNIGTLNASEGADIDGGAGQVNIRGGELCKLDLDMGVGEFNLRARLSGRNTFDMGIGAANVTLIGSPDDYCFDISKGLGDAKINGESVGSGKHGSGDTYVQIDGGIGSITVNTEG